MSAPVSEKVLVEQRGHVLLVTINRPEVRNAVDGEVHMTIGRLLDEVDADPDVRVVVITGAGDKAFSAGADLKATARGDTVLPPGFEHWGFAGWVRHPISKPTIAAVNGAAMGGGAELMFSCDLAVAAEHAVIGLPEVKVGMIAADGGPFRALAQLPQRVGMEMVLTGDPISAARALELNLVNRVVPAGQLIDAAMELAARIVVNAPARGAGEQADRPGAARRRAARRAGALGAHPRARARHRGLRGRQGGRPRLPGEAPAGLDRPVSRLRIGMPLSYSGGFREAAAVIGEYEAAGLDVVFVPEAWSFDAVSQLGYLAARTTTLQLAAGILNVYSRTPAAAGDDRRRDGRRLRRPVRPRPRGVRPAGGRGVPRRALHRPAGPHPRGGRRLPEGVAAGAAGARRAARAGAAEPGARRQRARQAAEAGQPPGARPRSR